MRLFAIKDETLPEDKILAYLAYYERSKTFVIELPDGADSWDMPLILSSFAQRGVYSIDSYWSRCFVQQRIVPQDRQNIGAILRDNGLKEYDEFSLLMLSMGRCEQDDCYLVEVPPEPLPEFLSLRWKTKIEEVVPMDAPRLLVFFQNGAAKVVDVQGLSSTALLPYLANQARFNTVEIQPEGFGVFWNDRTLLAHRDLYTHGASVPLTLDTLQHYVQNRIVNAAQACSILDCSRQNIDDLMRRDKLHPIRTDAKYKLFTRAEVMRRKKA